MIKVKKIVEGVLKGKYTILDANVLITKHYKNENFDLFLKDFKNEVFILFYEIMLRFSNEEYLKIINDVNSFNTNEDCNNKIIITKIYIKSDQEWEHLKPLYRKVGGYDCIMNIEGYNTTTSNSSNFKEFINLNDLVIKYISHSGYGWDLGFKNEILDELYHYPKLLEIIESLSFEQNTINESRTKKVIFETITNIDKKGWQYAFVSEQDYNLFTDLLTNFFEYKPYTLPETTIKLKRTCKTKVAKALGDIHKELSNENKLITDTKYFQLIRILNHFESETEGDLYKALTR